MAQALLFALLVSTAVLAFFAALWRLAPQRDDVTTRLDEYGRGVEDELNELYGQDNRYAGVQRVMERAGIAGRIAAMTARADIPVTPAEFFLIVVGIVAGALALGTWAFNLLAGILLAVMLGVVPFLYLRIKAERRRRAFTEQLPDVLTLLVGALRAGYGLNQALGVLVDQMPEPSAGEYARVLQAVNLGVPVQRALRILAERMGSDDFDLVVTAIVVQQETGGNLASVLETIGDTVRDRIRILREVRVLTAQQRLSGYILALMPVVLVIAISVLSPGFFAPLFEPGLIRLLPITAVALMLIGFLFIRKIVDIEV